MEGKYTKGEWEVKHSESKDAFNIVGTVLGGKYKIARCPYLLDKKETEANAILISAAPQLLEALQEMYQWFKSESTDGIQDDALELAKKAINKALK